jgi:hypothetical protein
MEYDFPKYGELMEYAQAIVDNNLMSDKDIDDLLTVLALDNEGENLLDYIEDYSSNEQIERITERGVLHIQYNARWQLAEIIYRRRPNEYAKWLNLLKNDKDSYVRQRARNVIDLLNEEKA